MTTLAWCVIVMFVLVLPPVLMGLEAVALGRCKWWEPFAGWAMLVGVAASIAIAACALAWAITEVRK